MHLLDLLKKTVEILSGDIKFPGQHSNQGSSQGPFHTSLKHYHYTILLGMLYSTYKGTNIPTRTHRRSCDGFKNTRACYTNIFFRPICNLFEKLQILPSYRVYQSTFSTFASFKGLNRVHNLAPLPDAYLMLSSRKITEYILYLGRDPSLPHILHFIIH